MNSEETLLSCLQQLNDEEVLRLQKIVREVEGSRHQECFILGTYLAQINQLEEALDLGWQTFKECFEAKEVGIKQQHIDNYWPK